MTPRDKTCLRSMYLDEAALSSLKSVIARSSSKPNQTSGCTTRDCAYVDLRPAGPVFLFSHLGFKWSAGGGPRGGAVNEVGREGLHSGPDWPGVNWTSIRFAVVAVFWSTSRHAWPRHRNKRDDGAAALEAFQAVPLLAGVAGARRRDAHCLRAREIQIDFIHRLGQPPAARPSLLLIQRLHLCPRVGTTTAKGCCRYATCGLYCVPKTQLTVVTFLPFQDAAADPPGLVGGPRHPGRARR